MSANPNTIVDQLGAVTTLQVQRAIAQATQAGQFAGASAGTKSFAAELLKRFDTDGSGQLNQSELASAAGADPQTQLADGSFASTAQLDTVDQIWAKAQAQSLAMGFGPGDAMLQALRAQDARDETAGKFQQPGDPFAGLFAA